MKKVIIAIIVALALAPTAHADRDGYLNALDTAGIYYKTSEAAFGLANAICTALENGAKMPDIARAITSAGYTSIEAGVITSSAIVHICPSQTKRIPTQLR